MSETKDAALDADWLALCRRAVEGARSALERYPLAADRAVTAGRGMGGDMALVIDRVVEDAIFEQLDSLGIGLTAVSEERGEVAVAGGGPVHVVIDPIDGSRNAKRGVPLFSLSFAVARGDRMGDVDFGYVYDFGFEEEWWAHRGGGAYHDGERLGPFDGPPEVELLGLETLHPALLAQAKEALEATGASRLRGVGSIALSLCWVAAGSLDGMLTLGPCRSVDTAGGQLIVTEAGGAVAFPEAGEDPLQASLSLDTRFHVVAAPSPELLSRLLAVGIAPAPS